MSIMASRQQYHQYQQSWNHGDSQSGNGPSGKLLRAAGPISQLQEFVQSDWLHPVPSHRPILHWSFDTRMGHAMVLEFRATVSFTLEGVLHHSAGSWQTAKKSAQRDAAQRVLWLAMDQWSKYSSEGGARKTFNEMNLNGEANVERILEYMVARLPRVPGAPNRQQKLVTWRFGADKEDSKSFQAVAEFDIFGVRHTFPGGFSRSKADAKEDCARRILWYLKCPGYISEFDVDREAAVLSEPPPLPSESEWQRDGYNAEAIVANDTQRAIAEQKTLLMRVQNRLQKAYVHQLPPGASVWDWSYEFSADNKEKLCRAWVTIHIANKEFKGDWCRGQKRAQIDACERVQNFLDSLEGGQGA